MSTRAYVYMWPILCLGRKGRLRHKCSVFPQDPYRKQAVSAAKDTMADPNQGGEKPGLENRKQDGGGRRAPWSIFSLTCIQYAKADIYTPHLSTLQEHARLHLGELAGGVGRLSLRSVRSHIPQEILRGLFPKEHDTIHDIVRRRHEELRRLGPIIV